MKTGSYQMTKAEEYMGKYVGQCGSAKQLAPRQLGEVLQPKYNQIHYL